MIPLPTLGALLSWFLQSLLACKTLPKTNLQPLLVGAARNNLLPQVKCFLDKGVNVDGKLKGYTALTWAAEQGYEKMVDFLISKGANVNARQDSDVNNGATVLMRAAIKGKFNIKADHKAVPALGFQIHGFQKYFSSTDRGT